MIILGIDPGSQHMGYGVIEQQGNAYAVLEYGTLSLTHLSNHALRLKHIYEKVQELIARTQPDECAVEMPVYGRNAQSMLKLGRAQAAAMLAVLLREIPVVEYTPKEVKKAVTGRGNASKKQVWFMIQHLLPVDQAKGLDAADALAVALCHAHRRVPLARVPYKTWKHFIQANPDRLRD